MRNHIKWILAAALLLMVGAHAGPLLVTHSAQDACSFGPVSNEQYRQLLAEASRRQSEKWPSLPWHNDRAAALLNERFDDVSSGTTSVYERLAAMHAVLRALGGDYRNTGHDRDDPYTEAARGGGSVGFNYNRDVNRIGFVAPLWRQSWIVGTLTVGLPDFPLSHVRQSLGGISFLVRFPEKLETYPVIRRSGLGEVCPRMPSAQWADRLDANHPSQR